MTEHIFFNLYPKPTLQPLVLSPAKRPDLLHLQFHNLGTNWSPQKCLNMAKKLCISWKCFPDVATRENAGLVVSLWIKGDAIFFMTRNTVTNLGTLDLELFIRGRQKHSDPRRSAQPRCWVQGDWDTWPTGWLGLASLLTRGTKALCSGTGRHAKTLIKRHELASPPSSHLEK